MEGKREYMDVEEFSSICGMKKGWEKQNVDAEYKTLKYGHN